MYIAASDAREAEQEARKQRVGLARAFLRADEAKSPTSADILRIRRFVASVDEGGHSYDAMLSEPSTESLFSCGALFFSHPNGRQEDK